MTAEDMFKANPIIPEGITRQACIAFMKTFAKYHVEQALKEVVESVNIYDYAENKDYSKFLEKDSILNAYPLDKIK
jgi:hypothetical protein